MIYIRLLTPYGTVSGNPCTREEAIEFITICIRNKVPFDVTYA